jgi:membrane-associated protease RseP (regulator of RpoE activity)
VLLAEPNWPTTSAVSTASAVATEPALKPEPGAEPEMDMREQRAALVRLIVVVVAGLVVAAVSGALDTVLVVLGLVLMIVLHEFGHFVMAKRAGMKVTEFFVGFGPRIWSIQRGETTYGVKALPLGGYCKIVGMTSAEKVDPADEARAYRNQPTWRKLSVALAGSFVHFLLAFTMLVILFVGPGDIGNFIAVPPSNDQVTLYNFAHGKTPAQLAGLRAGDRIVAVNGHHFSSWDGLVDYLRVRPGQRITLTIDRGGRTLVTSTVLANGAKVLVQGDKKPVYTKPTGLLGIEAGPVRFDFIGSVEHAGTTFGSTSVTAVSRLGSRVADVGSYLNMIGNQKAADSPKAVRFLSPVGVVVVANDATKVGWSEVLYLLIVINIFVGLFNLVPLPPLDGGHVAIALYEKVRSLRTKRPYHADINKIMPVAYAMVALILFYGVSSLFLDLRDLLT